MRVYREDPREVGLRRSQDAGVTLQQWPREGGEGGAVGWGRPEWVEPCDMDPGERDPEGCEAKGRGLDTKLYQAQWNPNPSYLYHALQNKLTLVTDDEKLLEKARQYINAIRSRDLAQQYSC